MDVQNSTSPAMENALGPGTTGGWPAPHPTTAPATFDPHGADQPKTWRWTVLVLTAIGFAVAGATGGFILADDAHELAELEGELAESDEDITELELELREEEDRRALQTSLLDDCRDAAQLTLTLVEHVDELKDADAEFYATAPGSAAEAEASARVNAAFMDVVGMAASVEQAATGCLPDKPA